MAKKSANDLTIGRMENGCRTSRLARLVKLLDMEDAAFLLLAYQYFPDEVASDLEMIETALHQGRREAIRELLKWYDLRNWIAANGDSTESLEKERSKLAICEGWARRMIIEASADKREPLTRDDVPF